MIYSVKVTNHLEESILIELTSPEKSGFVIRNIRGLGPVKAAINRTEMATNDGSMFNSARLPSRNIVMDLTFYDEGDIEGVRQKSYKYFPIKEQVHLVFTSDHRVGETVGYVESNDPDIFSDNEGSSISIVCPDPYFYSSGMGGTSITTFYGVDPVFEFPFSNESLTEPLLEMGVIRNQTVGDVIYEGDSEVGFLMYIHAIGEVKDISIYNLTTRESVVILTDRIRTLMGTSTDEEGIFAGDDIIISSVRGDKYATLLRAGVYYNILNCLQADPDWFTLEKGDNLFAYTAAVGTSNLQFRIENKTLYEGL